MKLPGLGQNAATVLFLVFSTRVARVMLRIKGEERERSARFFFIPHFGCEISLAWVSLLGHAIVTSLKKARG